MPKKVVRSDEFIDQEPEKSGSSFFDYLRFGESYTSLILGIIVVIISTALLLSFFNNRHVATPPANQVTQDAQSIAEISQKAARMTATQAASVTAVPTKAEKNAPTKVPAAEPTLVPTAKPTVKPSAKPTEPAKIAKATAVPTKVAPTKTEPTKVPQKKEEPKKIEQKPVAEGEYVVKAGDTLWSISERHYKSGYNWVDVARANKLSNPSKISVGTKLQLPKTIAKTQKVEPKKTVQVHDEQKNKTVADNKITSDKYKVIRGDSLWSIAEKTYGDGSKWVEIAKANKLTNPRVIHAGNQLMLPRGK